MGREARFQAIPEDCELLVRARQDPEIAEDLPFLKNVAKYGYLYPSVKEGSKTHITAQMMLALIKEHPGLEQRYFYGANRTFDAIAYLLSPARRTMRSIFGNDQSLIHEATCGSEPLHPLARATQGIPIGFVPTNMVRIIADYIEEITFEQFREHYDPAAMQEAYVYKMWATSDEQRLKHIWDEFIGMRDVYVAAAAHDEAMITVID